MMMHACKLESSSKDIVENKSLFIDFIGLHIVQHIIILSIECLHLLTVVPNFFYEIQQLLPIPVGGGRSSNGVPPPFQVSHELCGWPCRFV